jgi:hypothetical protein
MTTETNNILFLDLDGPAFPDAVIQYHPDQSKPYPGDFDMSETITYWKMCERFRDMWVHLYKTRDFKTVISSSWRKYYKDPFCFYDLFEVNGLPLELHDDWHTPIISSGRGGFDSYSTGYGLDCVRASEIHYWLQNHPEVKDFAILDDPDSGNSLLPDGGAWNTAHEHMRNNIVLVNYDTGLGGYDIQRMLNITKPWIK